MNFILPKRGESAERVELMMARGGVYNYLRDDAEPDLWHRVSGHTQSKPQGDPISSDQLAELVREAIRQA